MKLDIGSVAFNLNIINGGGTPSWGTSLGQNVNYNYSVPGVEELLTSMLYCKVKMSFAILFHGDDICIVLLKPVL